MKNWKPTIYPRVVGWLQTYNLWILKNYMVVKKIVYTIPSSSHSSQNIFLEIKAHSIVLDDYEIKNTIFQLKRFPMNRIHSRKKWGIFTTWNAMKLFQRINYFYEWTREISVSHCQKRKVRHKRSCMCLLDPIVT